MSTRRTGLGSLLLRRTDGERHPKPPEEHEPHRGPPDPTLDPGPGIDLPTEPTRKTNRARPRDRCTLYLDEDVNQQLDLVARVERRQRSEVVTELLRRHLPSYRISRR